MFPTHLQLRETGVCVCVKVFISLSVTGMIHYAYVCYNMKPIIFFYGVHLSASFKSNKYVLPLSKVV